MLQQVFGYVVLCSLNPDSWALSSKPKFDASNASLEPEPLKPYPSGPNLKPQTVDMVMCKRGPVCL